MQVNLEKFTPTIRLNENFIPRFCKVNQPKNGKVFPHFWAGLWGVFGKRDCEQPSAQVMGNLSHV
jgi:hypothetical protein